MTTDTNQKQNASSTKTTGQNGSSTSVSTKKRKKHRNRRKKSHTVVQKLFAPVREYISKCCNVPAKKPRTGSALGEGRGSGKDKDTTQVHGLGGWRCSACGKSAKVVPQAVGKLTADGKAVVKDSEGNEHTYSISIEGAPVVTT